jgi:uncharacterized protein YutE (UPF0331/DUF86 family)
MALSGRAHLLNENQVLYLFSTSSQVIAAIYGLTLTGFVFFRSELSREEFEDETLADAVEALKRRYFHLLIFITALVILTIILSNLAISYEDSDRGRATVLFMNAGQSSFITSLLAVAYFIFDVISPKRIELASRDLQNKLDPSLSEQTKGRLEDFLRNYNQIERLLENAGQPFQDTGPALQDKRYGRRFSNIRLAEVLLKSERIGMNLFHRLRELITLRNSIIHGAEPIVSQQVVQASGQVLEELRSALNGDLSDD